MNDTYIYFREDGLEFQIHCWDGELYFDVDYNDNLLLFSCGGGYQVLIDDEGDEDE